MLEELIVLGGDIALLRIAVLVFVFVLSYSLVTRIPSLSDKRIAFLVSLSVSLIAVLGFSDAVIVAIMAGYSGIGTVLILLLPIIGLFALIFWRSSSLSASFVKLLASILVLVFVEIISRSIDAHSAGRVLGYDVAGALSVISFALWVIVFFFAFGALSKLLFPAREEQRS